jgi:hypothetical protein
MANEPSYLYRGKFTSVNGEVLPFYFSSPFLVIECLLGNAPEYYYRAGYATPIFNSDIGEQLSGNSVRLAFGKRFYNFSTFPFDPSVQAFQLKINLKSWIAQLEANYFEVANWKEILINQSSEYGNLPLNENN